MAANSARHRHNINPAILDRRKTGIEAAPILCTASGAMPVTRMVPARPITKAPHQLVLLGRLEGLFGDAGIPFPFRKSLSFVRVAESPAPNGIKAQLTRKTESSNAPISSTARDTNLKGWNPTRSRRSGGIRANLHV
jgi:hypothetical protein